MINFHGNTSFKNTTVGFHNHLRFHSFAFIIALAAMFCLELACDHLLLFSASEPNLKVRSALKQKLESQRRITHSPILRRKDKANFLKRKPLSSKYITRK